MTERCDRRVITFVTEYDDGSEPFTVDVLCARPSGHDGMHLGKQGYTGILKDMPPQDEIFGFTK